MSYSHGPSICTICRISEKSLDHILLHSLLLVDVGTNCWPVCIVICASLLRLMTGFWSSRGVVAEKESWWFAMEFCFKSSFFESLTGTQWKKFQI